MAVNGYLSTFVHISHIVSTQWFFLPAAEPSVLWMTRLSSGWLLTSFSCFFFVFLSLLLVSPVVSAHQTWGRVSSCVPALLWWSSPFWQIPGETANLRRRESVTGADWQTVQFWHSTHRPLKPSTLMQHFISLGFSLLIVSRCVGVFNWMKSRQHVTKGWCFTLWTCQQEVKTLP